MGRICRVLGKQDARYSTPISPAWEELGVGASDWGPCPGLAGWSQRSPRVPAEGSEFLLLVCCPGVWKPHHHMLRAGPHPSNPLCQTSLGHCSARDWVSGKARESVHPKNHLTPSRGASPLGNTAPWWALRPHFLDCQIPPKTWVIMAQTGKNLPAMQETQV